MIRGQSYTTASDLWSAGVLLYAMCMGELPFEDENMQRLLQKIAYTEPTYPSNISPPLKDLISRMLTKNPAERITLQKIKEHPWFSKYKLHQMMNMNLGSNCDWKISTLGSGDIDREIIVKMTSLGYDCTKIVTDLIEGKVNKITAVYRMLRKVKITDQMSDISLAAIENRKLCKNTPQTSSITKSMIKRPSIPLPTSEYKRPRQAPGVPLPTKLLVSKLSNPEVASSMNYKAAKHFPSSPNRGAEQVPKLARPFQQLVGSPQMRRRSNSMRETDLTRPRI
ncbi:calcium/calmodulin-dependent protein kinase kinase [Tritrichomonas foetus]|uniref:Calcium/calmodulin-dependent protein kinase kinase n=1 Tax=Tritrichomonas foetus TaxID=1144522 RepID=A0A1J4KA41_9EUKA|nr:calcium/calmodulin-dependent protein kinase kinase [Tritrichomonas foetus]|eukprot:OHT08313.1 calcium/calmodulin-dependent protein kinase kinase [Tritrichomonas foetus]